MPRLAPQLLGGSGARRNRTFGGSEPSEHPAISPFVIYRIERADTNKRSVGGFNGQEIHLMDHERAQRVLRDRRRQQDARACYPCQQRKVKCDKSQPCRTCLKRGHPEICTFDLPPAETTPLRHRRAPRRDTPNSNTKVDGQAQRHNCLASEVAPPGNDSVPAILSSQVSSLNDEPVASDARAVLGMRNTLTNYLFTESQDQEDSLHSLQTIAPQRSDILKFYQYYCTHVAPFSPILIGPDQFELKLSAYLKAEAAGELKDRQRLAQGPWSTRKGINFISLLLSVLASGAFFSDDLGRTNLTLDFAKRSFQCLRLANFLFQPSTSAIQTLLILGNTLQNTGQSDAAWVMLGTTVRLTYTLSNAAKAGIAKTTEADQKEFHLLRSRVIWQDALLSMCHDRPPAIYGPGWSSELQVPSAANTLSYAESMNRLCQIAIEYAQHKALKLSNNKSPSDVLRSVDAVYAGALHHLRNADACKDMSQLLEHYVLKMHVSFFVTYVCRPAIRNSRNHIGNPSNDDGNIRTRAKESLVAVCKAFLELQALSTVPQRTWSMIHEVLSAVLLLYVWKETREDADCPRLQQRVVDVFTADMAAVTANESSSAKENNWLTPQHIRTLVTLQDVVAGRPNQLQSSSPLEQLNSIALTQAIYTNNDVSAVEPFDPFFSMATGVPLLDPNQGDSGLDGFSPLDYLNYYMNAPAPGSVNNEFFFP